VTAGVATLLVGCTSSDNESDDIGDLPRPGRLVFVSSEGAGPYLVHTTDADGREITKLGPDEGAFGPVWSPNGSQIAFISDGGIHTMNADGSAITRVTDYAQGEEFNPVWSPDGRQLAFSTDHDHFRGGPGYTSAVYVVDADGSNFRRLAEDASGPRWSPDGAQIAFSCELAENTWGICLMSGDGEGVSVLVKGDGGAPEWSRDGRRLLFVSAAQPADLLVIELGTGESTNLTNTHEAHESYGRDFFGQVASPWSPDGSKIVYARRADESRAQAIWLMQEDGSNPRPLVDAGPEEWFSSPVWSPDGRSVAFVVVLATPGDSDSDVAWRTAIEVIDIESGERRQITSSERSSILGDWAADARQ
jgi:Tol biopolymer transport system component